jgi:hypothetical protein
MSAPSQQRRLAIRRVHVLRATITITPVRRPRTGEAGVLAGSPRSPLSLLKIWEVGILAMLPRSPPGLLKISKAVASARLPISQRQPSLPRRPWLLPMPSQPAPSTSRKASTSVLTRLPSASSTTRRANTSARLPRSPAPLPRLQALPAPRASRCASLTLRCHRQ